MAGISKTTDAAPAADPPLLSAAAVRQRCGWFLDAAHAGTLRHFALDEGALDQCAQLVADETRANYPDLKVPYHSRWRHFETQHGDLAGVLPGNAEHVDDVRCRAALDLAFVSVLLDAGAGSGWQYRDLQTDSVYRRSEGLAVASARMFAAGLFSSDLDQPHQVDAVALEALDVEGLGRGLQVDEGNELPGLAGRVDLLKRLGETLTSLCGPGQRPADLVLDAIGRGPVSADALLGHLLQRLNSIWPQGLVQDGVAFGDVARHPLAGCAATDSGLVPFHKLSQWLAYSLIEPLAWGGIEVIELDGLTGLAEYRNGGLFIDAGVIRPIDPSLAERPLTVDSEPVVEWRALTVALLDALAPRVRDRLGVQRELFPLACLLQGGSWSTGRRLAQARHPDAAPPLTLHLTGTVF